MLFADGGQGSIYLLQKKSACIFAIFRCSWQQCLIDGVSFVFALGANCCVDPELGEKIRGGL